MRAPLRAPSALLLAWLPLGLGRIVDFEVDAGAKAEDASDEVQLRNGQLLNATLASLQPGDELLVPAKTFHLLGGIKASGLTSVTLHLEGTLMFSDNIKAWPTSDDKGSVLDCISLDSVTDFKITSSKQGVLNGNGAKWWGLPGIGYLIRAENRPKLLRITNAKNCLFENFLLKDSPYWTFHVSGEGVEIRRVDIDVRRTRYDGHDLIDMTAFNTDGIDVNGKDFWVHDCNIWNQDDSIAVKDGSENMLFERLNASGVGLTIGSIGSSTVRNITFRDCYMHHTFKGIYMKFRDSDGSGFIGDILYENIVIDTPEQVPIWIGPAQQSDSRDFWAGHPCSIFWPLVPGTTCHVPTSTYKNITLRNITVLNPKQSPGLIMGNATNPMQGVTFDNVIVKNPGSSPWGKDFYKCEAVQGVATGRTWPVPPCFEDRTSPSEQLII